jgi:hypothetical protein
VQTDAPVRSEDRKLEQQNPTPYQKPNADKIRAVVMTKSFCLEGDLYCPRLGKDGRRLSNMLNTDKRFVAMTNVVVINRNTGVRDPKSYPLIQVNTSSVEFVQPYMDETEVLKESQ